MAAETRSYSGTRFGGFYFLAQGVAVGGWWLLLWLRPASRAIFIPAGASEVDLIAFALPDLALLSACPLLAGALTLVRSPLAFAAGWLAAGAVDYATLYCISWAALRGGGWGGVVAMAPAALFATLAALDGSAGVVPIFRRARPAPARRHVMATVLQIAVFWGVFLLAVPTGIVTVERAVGVPALAFPGQVAAGLVVLVVSSALSFASGMVMAARGVGTPLPMDGTNRLVCGGPYAYVRNPMMVAGVGQGLAVAMLVGSASVAAYVLVGALIWQGLVRPAEEAELAEKFGEEFAAYRSAVRCWIPRRAPYLPPPSDRDPLRVSAPS